VFIEMLVLGALAAGFFYVRHAAAQPGADPQIVAQWAEMSGDIGPPSAERLARTMALYGGSWRGVAHHQLTRATFQPLAMLLIFGWEVMGSMLLGMASLKSGFFTGAWEDARYRKVAVIGLSITIPAYCLFAWIIWSSGYEVPVLFAFAEAAPAPFRPIMVFAIAALIILLTRRGGPLVARIAAAGRAAFTNYLGTSILMTGLFYGWGFGLFGSLRRAELWLVVIAMWAVMLIWSKPWLDRYQYGPFEWVWRSLARWRPQPMRRVAESALAA
jgi:uncharacterized protein